MNTISLQIDNPPASLGLAESLAGSSDSQLVRQALAGQTEAFGRVFSNYQASAFGLALSYTRNREDARDVVQDAFIKAFQNLRRFDLRRNFGPWLMSIVRNLSIDLLRRRKHASHELIPETIQDRRAHRYAERGLIRRDVRAVLMSLTEKHRQILLLRDYLGYSYLEIADTLSIPLGTVMSRLHQARKRFRHVCRQRSAARAA